MFKFVGYSITIISVAWAAPFPSDSNLRVVGGKNATQDYPYMASLREKDSGGHFCGGCIINHHWVLSAAHCVKSRPPSYTFVWVGTRFQDGDGTSYATSRVVFHPNYATNPETQNDIAVVRTFIPIQFTELVKPIPVAKDLPRPGSTVRLTGWGLTSINSYVPNSLQEIDLLTISLEECQTKLSGVSDGAVCTYNRVGEGACYGDSGGPGVYNDEIIATVSWGNPCATGYPDVHMNVPIHRDWIYNTTLD